MRVHHIDCASLCPLSQRLINGNGSLVSRGTMVAHCLLIETPSNGLVLVDTGLGTADLRDPAHRLGRAFVSAVGVGQRPTITAIEHIAKLGHSPRDVTNIVVTHLDLDHAGGLSDLPHATVHVHTHEHNAAMSPSWRERARYRQCQFAHSPHWSLYSSLGEPWKGFEAVRSLPGLPPEILAIPLPGHTRGHACIAVETDNGWLLHAGDAFFHRSVVDPGAPEVPPGLALFESLLAIDRHRVLQNHRRLGALAQAHSTSLKIFCAHDPEQFASFNNQP